MAVVESHFNTNRLDPVGEVVRSKCRGIEITRANRKNGENNQWSGDSPWRLMRTVMGAMIVMCTMVIMGIAVVIIVVGMSSAMCVVVAFIVMLPCRSTTRLAKEREVGRSRHVRRRHKRPDESNIKEELITVVAGVINDLVLGEEP